MIDREIQNTKQVDIRVDHHIGDIPMYKDLTRLRTRDPVGRHPAVAATDPKELRRLQTRQALEIVRVPGLDPRRPVFVISQQFGYSCHIFSPPQTLITCPVIYELISLARNKAVSAISSTFPKRPSGISSRNFFAPSPSLR